MRDEARLMQVLRDATKPTCTFYSVVSLGDGCLLEDADQLETFLRYSLGHTHETREGAILRYVNLFGCALLGVIIVRGWDYELGEFKLVFTEVIRPGDLEL